MPSFCRWLAGLTDSVLQLRHALSRKQKRPHGRARLALEGLEDRAVPAALVAPGTEATYVRDLYVEVLGRSGSDAEVAGYVRDLQAGRSPDSVASAFLTSPEYFSRRVGDLYQSALNRPADPVGLVGHVSILQRSGSERDVLASLLGSAEYNALHPDNASFVQGLYEDALGRTPSAAEAATYEEHLASGVSRSEIIQAFLTSPERGRREIDGLFRLYLGRSADEP